MAAVESQPGKHAWNRLIKEHCDPEDLAWMLYRAIDNIDSANEFPKPMLAYMEARASVLRNINCLKAEFKQWMNVQFDGVQLWFLLAKLSNPDVGADRELFALFLVLIDKIEERLNELNEMPRRVKPLRSEHASQGEVWLQAYVESATKKLFRPEVSVLLEVAAQAYGLEGGVFTEDAVSRRYGRYRKHHPKTFAKLQQCLKDFRSERSSNVQKVELDRFLCQRLLGPILDICRKIKKAETLEEKCELFSQIDK